MFTEQEDVTGKFPRSDHFWTLQRYNFLQTLFFSSKRYKPFAPYLIDLLASSQRDHAYTFQGKGVKLYRL